MSKQVEHDDRDSPTDSPVAWFAVLERARRIEDFEMAAQALRELERLGVRVKYHSARSWRKGRTDA